MKSKFNAEMWAEEFREFMDSPEVRPPQHVSESLLEFVRRDLNPGLWNVLGKLGIIHTIMGSLSLLVCAQFGIGRGTHVNHLFMSLGELACMGICGALFLGVSLTIASMVLSASEAHSLRKHRYVHVLILSALSLFVFFCLGAEIGVSLGLAWLLGATISGILVNEVALGMRRFVPIFR